MSLPALPPVPSLPPVPQDKNALVAEARRIRDELLKKAPGDHILRNEWLERTDWILSFLGAKNYAEIKTELLENLKEFRNTDLKGGHNDYWKPFRLAVIAAAKSLGKSALEVFTDGTR